MNICRISAATLCVLVLAGTPAVFAARPETAVSGGSMVAATERPSGHQARESIPDPDVIVVENFAKYADGKFPTPWKSWPLQRDKVKQVYRVKTEGAGRYLHASDDKDISQQIMLPIMWNIEKYPYLNWRWRPQTLPKGATESDDEKNDSACGVYVIYGRYSGVAAKYVWSTALPVGTVVSRRDGKLRITPVGSGPAGVGSWHSHSVNVPESYRKLFGAPMERTPTGVAVLTDGNATHTPAACDYADFSISTKPLH